MSHQGGRYKYSSKLRTANTLYKRITIRMVTSGDATNSYNWMDCQMTIGFIEVANLRAGEISQIINTSRTMNYRTGLWYTALPERWATKIAKPRTCRSGRQFSLIVFIISTLWPCLLGTAYMPSGLEWRLVAIPRLASPYPWSDLGKRFSAHGKLKSKES